MSERKKWNGKMKPSEYEKVRAWCRDNGYSEYDKNLFTFKKNDFALYKHVLICDGYNIYIDAIGGNFVDSNQRFVLLSVNLSWFKPQYIGIYNKISIHRTITTLKELKSFVGKSKRLIEISEEFEL